MKILFVTGLYARESEDSLRNLSGNSIQNAPNVFQWSIVNGLYENNYDFEVVSLPFLPSYPIKFKAPYTPNTPILYKDRQIGDMLSYCALVGCKYLSIEHRLRLYVEQWIKVNKDKYSQLVVLTYTPHYAFINAINDAINKCSSKEKVVIASIVTDLVDDMLNFVANRSLLKRLQCRLEQTLTKKTYKYIDKFILLTKAMEDKIPESVGVNIVVEGLASYVPCMRKKNVKRDKATFLYTGSLDEFTCIRDLINAFMLTTSPKYELIVCGDGALAPYVECMSKEDSRIVYLGKVSHEYSVKLQQQASCLVNPRKPNGAITKYSFPSKTMEYMTSGTPMIGYKLEGIPEEYYEYMYIPADLSDKSLAQIVEYVAGLEQSVLNNKAMAAYEFIMKHKTSQTQVERIVQFIQTDTIEI